MEDRLYTIWISEPKAITLNKNFFFFYLKKLYSFYYKFLYNIIYKDILFIHKEMRQISTPKQYRT